MEDFEMNEWNSGNECRRCPYCGRKAKDEAVNCRYCWASLDEQPDLEKKQVRVWYKNKWIWIILAIIVVLIPLIYNSNWWKYKRYEKLYDKSQEYASNAKSLDEIKEEIKNAEGNTSYENQAFAELWEIIDEFSIRLNSIGQIFLEIEDLKDKEKIEEAIKNRKSYSELFNRYSDEASKLFNKYKSLDGSWNWKYSLNELSKEIKKLAEALSVHADANIEFYKYILSVQNDFFIDDGMIYFTDGWSKLEKYNKMLNNLTDESMKYAKAYNNYMEYLDKYNKYYGYQ